MLYPILLFLLALAPRLVALNRYITPDELIWVYRSIRFREALLAGQWAETLVAGHPGVTTTWLGALATSAQLLLSPASREAYAWLTRVAALTPDNVEAYRQLAHFLSAGRLAVALVNSAGVVAAYLMARRLWGRRAALIGGLFLALDPFLAGLSGLFHVDGLSATFVTIALLALALAIAPAASRRSAAGWAALAGGAVGLSILTKTPTLALLPLSAGVLVWPLLRRGEPSRRDRLPTVVAGALAWGAALAMILLVYPALWASPGAVLATAGGSANRHLQEALRETFFLGRVAFNHGPLFYPVTLLWRLSPVVWLALIPAIWGFFAARRQGRRPRVAATQAAVILAAWAILFLVAITPAAKKFDRYILPVVPALLLLAAAAWVWWARLVPRAGRVALPLVVGAQAFYWLFFAAYPLSAYNPLAGGPWTAARVLPAGWGEGISAAGRELARTQPDAADERAIAGVVASLAPFFPGVTLVDGRDDPATADYVIVTRSGRQLDPAAISATTAGLPLLATIRFGGLEQAWVYRQAAPAATAGPAELAAHVVFGERLALAAAAVEQADDLLRLGLRWRRLQPLAPDDRYTLRLTVRDDEGNVWSAQEAELLNEVHFYPPDWATDETGIVTYDLELPPGIPPSTYHVDLTVIDDRTAGQLPARTTTEPFLGVTYDVGTVEVAPPPDIVSASRVQIPVFRDALWLDGRMRLLGQSELTGAALAGGRAPVDLFWHVPQGTLPAGMQLTWSVRPVDGGEAIPIWSGPLSRYDTGRWRTGETIQEKYRAPLPPDLTPGRYELVVEPETAEGVALGEPVSLGELRVDNIDRLYERPEDMATEPDVDFGALRLSGASPDRLTAAPGETVELALVWEKVAAHGEVYTVFFQVLDEAGNIVLSADHWPGGLPTDILDAGQVVIDRVPLLLPGGLPAGDYRIRVGLYDAGSGRRLPVLDATGGQGEIGPDSVILPIALHVSPE